MVYTTVDLISAELNGVTINSTTVPSSTVVDNWIDEVTSEIDIRTGKVWTTSLESSTVVDYDGSGFIRLPKAPVLSITELKYATTGLGASSVSWSTLTSGRTNDYILHVLDGEIELTGKTAVPKGTQNITCTYTAGYTTTPPYITRLATLMAAKRFVQTVVQASAKEEGGSVTVGNISITDPTQFGANQVRNMDTEIDDIINNRLGSARVYRPKRVYNLRY